jgi:hypothetical protein
MLVAGVCELICDKCVGQVNKEDVVAAALIHDLGNFVKMTFDGKTEKELFDKEDHDKIEFFKKKKEEFALKYSPNDGEANILIAKEIHAPKEVIHLLENKEIHHLTAEQWKNDFGLIIFFYSDLRVSPQGVAPLAQRLKEFQKRNKFDSNPEQIQRSKEFTEFAMQVEEYLFSYVKIKPELITQDAIKKYYDKY